MKEYILNIKFGTWQNQLWFMGEDNEENWQGQNLLGKVLNKVREDLR